MAYSDNNNDNPIFVHIIITFIMINNWYFFVVNHWFGMQCLFNTDYVIMDNMIQVQIQYYSVSSRCSFGWFFFFFLY